MLTLYATLPDALLVVRGVPGRWQAARQLDGLAAQCVAVDALQPARVYCGTFGQGLWSSDDAGDTWQMVSGQFTSQQVRAVAVSRTERQGGYGVVYAGTEPTALYRSEDGGATWHALDELPRLPSAPTWSFPPRPYTSHVRALALDPNAAGHVAAAIEAGALVWSRDSGRTWEDRRPDAPRDSHTLAMPIHAPGWMYSAAGDGFLAPGNGFWMSRDGGETWERPATGLRHHYLWGLAVDPGNADTVLVSAATSPDQAHNPNHAESAIYRKTGGGPWRQVQAGLPESKGMLAAALAANEAEPGVFYAGSNLGLFRSADDGESWQRLAIAWPERPDAQRVHDLAVTGAE